MSPYSSAKGEKSKVPSFDKRNNSQFIIKASHLQNLSNIIHNVTGMQACDRYTKHVIAIEDI